MTLTSTRLILAGLTASLGLLTACATPADTSISSLPRATAEAETMRFDMPVNPADNGLTWAQIDAISVLADEYKARGHGPLVISYPQGGSNEQAAMQAIALARTQFYDAGIDWRQITGGAYDARGLGHAPVIFSFTRYRAVGPDCEPGWDYLATEFDNVRHRRFGCAMAANLAAMIADPHDLIAPRGQEPSDSGRRQTVIDRYRAGQNTATERGDSESGLASQVNSN